MKISIEPQIATQLLKQYVAEYDELFADLQQRPEVFGLITELAKNSGLQGYIHLYQEDQILIKLSLLTLMPAEQVNELNAYVKSLTIEEASLYANQALTNLNDSSEKMDEIFDPLFPHDVDSITPEQLSPQAKFAITTFLVWFYDILSFLVHGRRITDLVKSALKGSDEAICLAAQIDKSILALPAIKARLDKALPDENDEDAKLIYNLFYRVTNPVLKGQIKHRNVWIALFVLDVMNMLDGSLTRAEILAMMDAAGVKGLASEDNLSRILRRYRSYQKKI